MSWADDLAYHVSEVLGRALLACAESEEAAPECQCGRTGAHREQCPVGAWQRRIVARAEDYAAVLAWAAMRIDRGEHQWHCGEPEEHEDGELRRWICARCGVHVVIANALEAPDIGGCAGVPPMRLCGDV